jgi:DNA adenine methylase
VARPVVKWAGGKTRLLDHLLRRMPPGEIETYAEPFAGGAALFFCLATAERRVFKRAVLADKNADLVALYQAIQGSRKKLVDKVRAYRDEHMRREGDARREHYYEVRNLDTAAMKPIDRAARLLFLNKTCFNGLWRVNASGQFNVPFGRYAKPKILDVEALKRAEEALAGVKIVLGDYRAVTKRLVPGDFAYFDPPYVPVSKTANFTSYAKDRFGDDEQEALADELARLHERGVKAMLSNAATPKTRSMYARRGLFADVVPAPRAINSDPNKRGDVDELVVTTYRLEAERARSAS